MISNLKGLKNRLDACYRRDQFRLRRAIEKLESDLKNGHDVQQAAEALAARFEGSVARVQTRISQVPKIEYPDLPVSDKRDDILQAILSHQVVIVCGETGSGKTCLLYTSDAADE